MVSTERINNSSRISQRRPLQALLLFNGLSALFGGSVLVAAPDGSILGMPLLLLATTPFADFLLPGLILFTVLGVGSSIGWMLVYRRHPWATRWVQMVGTATIVWIVTQMIMLRGVSFLHVIYITVGILLILLAKRGAAFWRP